MSDASSDGQLEEERETDTEQSARVDPLDGAISGNFWRGSFVGGQPLDIVRILRYK